MTPIHPVSSIFLLFIHFILFDDVAAVDVGGLICRMPLNEGFACETAPYSAFYFDLSLGECIPFQFRGCGGNQNRFMSRKECDEGCKSMGACPRGLPLMDSTGTFKRCEGDRIPCPATHHCVTTKTTTLCCLKPDRICSQNIDSGTPCGIPSKMRYYYDLATSNCRPFSFTGCGGNENNFQSKGECAKFCATQMICSKGDPLPSPHSSSHILTCSDSLQCPSNHTCEMHGQSRGACCPSKALVCGTPLSLLTNCVSTIAGVWTFSPSTGTCSKVLEKVCADQLNSFTNLDQCLDYCIGSCPRNLPLYINPSTQQPQLCSKGEAHGCPLGYECMQSSPFARVCCKQAPKCPTAESSPFARGNEVLRCSPDHESCPRGYACTMASNLEHICCSRPLQCPPGLAALREKSVPRVCTIGVPGTCPSDHLCVRGVGEPLANGAASLCCKPEETCAAGANYLGGAQRCTPGDGRCPLGTRCLASSSSLSTKAIDLVFECCLSTIIVTCPDGTPPLRRPRNHSIVRCTSSSLSDCPSTFTCDQLSDDSFGCCSIPQEECIEAFSLNGIVLPCRGNADCPKGSCTRSSDGKHYCCIEKGQTAMISPLPPRAKQIIFLLQHIFTILSIVFALLAIFVIITVKDRKSRTYSRLILTIVIVTLISDLYLVLVLDPTYFSPLPCLVRDEPLLNIPGRTSVHHVIWVSLMFLDSPLFLSCFFHRLQVVLSPGSRLFFSSRVKRGIPIILAIIYPLLPTLLHKTMQPPGSILQYSEMLSLFPSSLFTRADCFYPDRLKVANTLGSILMTFNFIAAILMVCHTFAALRKHCSMSAKMQEYHRMMTIVLILQSGVPIVFALFPLSILFSVYLYNWDGTVIIPVCFTLISSHSFLHSIAVLTTTPVYRIRMRTLICRDTRQSTMKLSTVLHSQFSK